MTGIGGREMKEKYFYIESDKAKTLLSKIKDMKAEKRGFDSHVYLISEYAVLTSSCIKRRNVITHDDNLMYFDELIKTLMDLQKQNVAVIPILGYCFDPDCPYGKGYIFQPRAKGEELYDDAVMKQYYVPPPDVPSFRYLSSDKNPKEYILSRTAFISKIPQIHFNKFINDMIVLFDNDVLIDFNGKSNFFYDASVGFQFIDLDSHTDFKYGLSEQKPDSKKMASIYGFVPCLFAAGTKAFPYLALDEKAVSVIGENELQQLAKDNKTIMQKCKTAILANGISEEQLNNALETIKIYAVNSVY